VRFINILLILLLIYFVGLLLVRYVFPFFLKRFIKKMSRDFDSRFNSRDNRKEGEVSFDYRQKEKKKYDRDDGEYVDYEEVE